MGNFDIVLQLNDIIKSNQNNNLKYKNNNVKFNICNMFEKIFINLYRYTSGNGFILYLNIM